ncbi:hypothetical protein [Baekduia sp. Peel2402]|uniref:hypothetical protein n=1 Tax=Baekduia sp. Peel2402 TaxID=3458296 RepID=UPI00403EA4C9
MRTPGKVTAALVVTIASVVVAPASAGALTLGGVTTKSVKDVTARSVTLEAEATVSVLGASVSFQFGPTTTYGLTSGNILTSLIGVKETVSVPVTGLMPGTTYHVRAVASSGLLGSVLGRDVTFKTKEDKSGGDDGTGVTIGVTVPGTSGSGSGTGSSGSGSSGSGSSGSSDSGSSSSGSSGSGSGKGDDSSSSTTSSPTSSSGSSATQDATDPAAAIPAGQATAAITPVLGKTLAIAAVQGTVTATSPTGVAVDLSDARGVPSGTIIDTRAGTVELTTALTKPGSTQTGRFWGGMFEVRQTAGDRGLTQIVLRGADFRQCQAVAARKRVKRSAAKQATKKKQPSRALWGSDDHGKFQTRGRGSVATVRGTRWMTEDSCEGTLTRVADGAVEVRDFGADRTVVVHKGHQYRARVAP